MMRQLQAWWSGHAYNPRHASSNDEGGTVKVHLVIRPDGRIFTVNMVESSGSRSLDAAGSAVFRDAFVRPFPEGEPSLSPVTEVGKMLQWVGHVEYAGIRFFLSTPYGLAAIAISVVP